MLITIVTFDREQLKKNNKLSVTYSNGRMQIVVILDYRDLGIIRN